jgi:hypothetical protein
MRARDAGVTDMLVVGGFDEERRPAPRARSGGEFGLPASAGVHPHEARLWTAAVEDELRGLAREKARPCDRRDRSRLPLRPLAARRAAGRVPQAAPAGPRRRPARDRPLRREADDETCTILEEERANECGWSDPLFHRSATSSPGASLALGFYLSFSGILAFPRSETIQEVAPRGSPRPECSWRPTPRSWRRRRIGESATSRRSWSRSRASWRSFAWRRSRTWAAPRCRTSDALQS